MPEDKEYLPSSQRDEGAEHIVEGMGLESKFDNLKDHLDAAKIEDMFKFHLGCKVRNRHNEDGYIEMCAIDNRGEVYLVNFPGHKTTWYTEFEIRKIAFDPENRKKDQDDRIKTDIKQPNEISPGYSPELG